MQERQVVAAGVQMFRLFGIGNYQRCMRLGCFDGIILKSECISEDIRSISCVHSHDKANTTRDGARTYAIATSS